MKRHCDKCEVAAEGVAIPPRKIDKRLSPSGNRVDGTGKVYVPGINETLRLACDPSQFVCTSGRLGGERT